MNDSRLLYVSKLSPGFGPAAVASITRISRLNNARDGISGLLIFDGESFAQLLDGPQPAIEALLERLQADARHGSIDLQILQPLAAGRRFPTWQLAYHEMADCGDGIAALRGLRGSAALAAFDRLVPSLDRLDVGSAI